MIVKGTWPAGSASSSPDTIAIPALASHFGEPRTATTSGSRHADFRRELHGPAKRSKPW